jgi:hypothetical protein
MPDLSPQAVARARDSIDAAPVFAANASRIAELTPELLAEQVLVAVVNPQHQFAGVWVVDRADVVTRVPVLEADGWAMVFSPGADAEQVRYRAAEMASLAEQRIETIARLSAKRRLREPGAAAQPGHPDVGGSASGIDAGSGTE